LGQARVVGIEQPVELYQLSPPAQEIGDLFVRYEAALTAFESRDLRSAAGELAFLVQKYPDDSPSIILLSRVVEFLTRSEQEFDPVWKLKTK
jgi:TolA-binding protein